MTPVKIKALRGVCIGVDRHLQPGEVGEVDAATVQFLESIKAVERVVEAPVQEEPAPVAESPAAPSAPVGEVDAADDTDDESKGKKKKR